MEAPVWTAAVRNDVKVAVASIIATLLLAALWAVVRINWAARYGGRIAAPTGGAAAAATAAAALPPMPKLVARPLRAGAKGAAACARQG